MKTIIFFFLLFISFTSIAQQKEKFIPQVTHSIGGSFQQFDGLNARIADLPQYKKLNDYTANLGLGWTKERNRVISAGGIILGSSLCGKKDEKSSTIRYIGITADLGYDILKDEKMVLYPFAGLGFQKYQAIFYKDNTTVAFDDVLESPTTQNDIRSLKFKNSFAIYRLGVGFSISCPKYPSHSIGIQGGYSGSFKKNDWKSNENQKLGQAPEDNISQFFISVVFSSKMMCKK